MSAELDNAFALDFATAAHAEKHRRLAESQSDAIMVLSDGEEADMEQILADAFADELADAEMAHDVEKESAAVALDDDAVEGHGDMFGSGFGLDSAFG